MKVVLDAPLDLTTRYDGITLRPSEGKQKVVMCIQGSTEYLELHFTRIQARQLSDALDLVASELSW